jgi:hypothetical protein
MSTISLPILCKWDSLTVTGPTLPKTVKTPTIYGKLYISGKYGATLS